MERPRKIFLTASIDKKINQGDTLKKQYFQEVDSLLILEKRGQEITESFQVAFDVQQHGWVKMHMSLEDQNVSFRSERTDTN